MKHKILIVDDEESIRWVLGKSLEKAGYEIDYGINGKEAIEKSLASEYGSILLDIKLPDISGFDVLKKIKENRVRSPVILITAQNTVNNAIRGIKIGAYDYVAKPFNLEEVNTIVTKSLASYNQLIQQKGEEEKPGLASLGEIVGESSEMLKIYKTVGRIADKDITVLITGESGTGKELITRAIHHNSSRKDRKLVSVNIAAIPNELIESELFGHEKGAFTGAQSKKTGRFEEAQNGTLHIDEIGEMSVDLQTKLLRVLEEKKLYRLGGETPVDIDVRIIASTNRDLKEQVENGNFREDLYYRLNAITLNLPPLRSRTQDIPILLDHFTGKYSQELDLEKKTFSGESIEILKKYHWPGNVRELENTVKRIMVLTPDKLIEERHLEEIAPYIFDTGNGTDNFESMIRDELSKMLSGVESSESDIYSRVINRVEKQLFSIVLNITKGNKKKAASMLGINRNTLSKKLSDLDIDTF